MSGHQVGALWICVVAQLAWLTAPARAQTSAGAVYVQGGGGAVWQSGPTGTEYETYVTAPGGFTAGWQAGGGVGLARTAAVDVEWSRTGTMAATEPSRYFTTFEERRRDQFLTVALRLMVPAGRALAFEPVVGVALTFSDNSSRAIYTDPLALRALPPPPVHHVLDRGIGPAFGIDARIGSGRWSLVPGGRITRSAIDKGRYDNMATSPKVEISSIYPGGYPEWTTRASVALRVGL